MKCYATRTDDAKCCPWCASVSGRYKTNETPKDFWRRHDNCSCIITYETSREVQTLKGSNKKWDVINSENKEYSPNVFDRQQAKNLEQQNLNYRGIDKLNESDTIIGRGSSTGHYVSDNHTFEKIGKIDFNDKNAISQSLVEFENKYINSDIEHCRVITSSGEIYDVHGDSYRVDTSLLGDKLKGSINEHNHVIGESQYSFSWEDIKASAEDGSHIVIAYDEKYRYRMIFPDTQIPEDYVYNAYQNAKNSVGNDLISNSEKINKGDEQHEKVKRTCEKLGIEYTRTPKRIS